MKPPTRRQIRHRTAETSVALRVRPAGSITTSIITVALNHPAPNARKEVPAKSCDMVPSAPAVTAAGPPNVTTRRGFRIRISAAVHGARARESVISKDAPSNPAAGPPGSPSPNDSPLAGETVPPVPAPRVYSASAAPVGPRADPAPR